ncbi:MAG: FtsX-like permease family protein, partial [Planctomycetia bacterium]
LTRSLRRLALARLGGIRAAVLSDGLFRARLADETEDRLRSRAAAGGAVGPARDQVIVPAVVMEVTLERAAGGERGGAAGSAIMATLLACDEPDRLGFSPGAKPLAADAVAINRVLAEALGAREGDPVILRLTKIGDVPADSPMGRRTAESWSRRLVVTEVLPVAGIGEFSLRPTQVTAALAVTGLHTAQSLVRRSEPVANMLFAVGGSGGGGATTAAAAGMPAADSLRTALEPTLDDLGLSFDQPPGSGAWRLSSRRLLLPPEADRAAKRVLAPLGGRPTLVFLANALTPLVDGRPGRASIPYSTVVGIDSTSLPVGDLIDDRGEPLEPPGPDEIVIDRWMADDLAAQGTPVAVGDRLEVRSFLPETLHGRVEEQDCTLVVSGIAAMRGAAIARDLVPEVEGITDEASIADWDPPFPFDRSRVRTVPPHDEDDRYWKAHGATPKAFVSLAVARRLAGSRFGETTAWHLPAAAAGEPDAIRGALARAAQADGLGMRVVSLREKAEAAARGSTPFGSLFLALSSFIVVAGLLLEWLLFSLLVAARRRDIGILSAIGWPASRVMRLLAGVAAGAVLAGVAAGTVLGPLWSRLLVGWLATAWDKQVAAGSGAAFGAAGPVFTTEAMRVLLPAAAAAAAVSLAGGGAAARR